MAHHRSNLLRLASAALLLCASTAIAQQLQPAGSPPSAAGFPGGPNMPAGNYNVSTRSAADRALPSLYVRDESFFKLPDNRKLGASSTIEIDRDGKSIWVYDHCGGQDNCIGSTLNPVMLFDETGKLVRQFGAGVIVYPHGIAVDRDGNLWVADLQSNVDRPPARPGQPAEVVPKGRRPNGAQVLKFSPTGKLLLTIGTPGVYGNDATHLSQPSDVITAPDGSVFVADGHDSLPSNHRIAKFDRNGKFIKAWDACGGAIIPGGNNLDCQHSLAMDSQGRLFVANRSNSRIEIFDQDGNVLDEWSQFGKPSGLFIDKHDMLYAVDSESSARQGNSFIRGMHVGNARTGEVTSFTADPLGNPTPWFPLRGTSGAEGVTVADDGTVYTSQVTPFGLAKYTRKPK